LAINSIEIMVASLPFVKRIQELPPPAAKMADHGPTIRRKRPWTEPGNRRNCRERPAKGWKRRPEHRGTRSRGRGSMIRHASRSLAFAISAPAVAMIQAAFLRLLMTAVGNTVPDSAGKTAAEVAAIGLSPLTRGTDEEDHAATRRAAEALPERSVTIIRQVGLQSGWTAETEGGKMQPRKNLCFRNGASKVWPRLFEQPGLYFSLSPQC